MNKIKFYKLYIPALIKAFLNEDDYEQYSVKGPESFLDVSHQEQKEIEIYLDQIAGKDDFLDNVAYYFDAKSHGFPEINGVNISIYRAKLINEISLKLEEILSDKPKN